LIEFPAYRVPWLVARLIGNIYIYIRK
jgi:hypothetical protein